MGNLEDALVSDGCSKKKNRFGTVFYEDANGDIVAKLCRKCESVKLLDDFSNCNNGFVGKQPKCKECARAIGSTERARESNKIRSRKYREVHGEKLNAQQRERYRDNPEKYKEVRRLWYEQNPDKKKLYGQRYYESHKESELERQRKFRKANPERHRMYWQKRKVAKSQLPNTLTESEYTETLAFFNHICALTGDDCLHMDHVIPISSGHGGHIKENVVPLRSDLNESKNDSNLFDWFEFNQERFQLSNEMFDRMVQYLADLNGMSVIDYRKYYDSCFE